MTTEYRKKLYVLDILSCFINRSVNYNSYYNYIIFKNRKSQLILINIKRNYMSIKKIK